MNKVISYSLFGYNKVRQENCFDFHSYIRGLMINLRLARLIYPGWQVILQLDRPSYDGWKNFFHELTEKEILQIRVHDEEAVLTKAMLWRLCPIFEEQLSTHEWNNSHVICRDLDSPISYREAQAVQYWINKDKAVHAITDSISHDVPMLGGMIGFRPAYFTERMNVKTFEQLIALNPNLDWTKKGMDQTFLTHNIYPKFAQHGTDSITQHYCLGMPNTFLSDYHNSIQDLELPIPYEMKESNDGCCHIGQSGWNETGLFKFLFKHWDKFNDILEVESNYKSIFYWGNHE